MIDFAERVRQHLRMASNRRERESPALLKLLVVEIERLRAERDQARKIISLRVEKIEGLETEIELLRAGKTKHDGDCTIYAALMNERPEDGICTCGFGQQQIWKGRDYKQMYSKERKATFPVVSDAEVKAKREFIEKHFK